MSKCHGTYILLLNSDNQDMGGYRHAKRRKSIISLPGMQAGKKATGTAPWELCSQSHSGKNSKNCSRLVSGRVYLRDRPEPVHAVGCTK